MSGAAESLGKTSSGAAGAGAVRKGALLDATVGLRELERSGSLRRSEARLRGMEEKEAGTLQGTDGCHAGENCCWKCALVRRRSSDVRGRVYKQC